MTTFFPFLNVLITPQIALNAAAMAVVVVVMVVVGWGGRSGGVALTKTSAHDSCTKAEGTDKRRSGTMQILTRRLQTAN